ncbi:MAG: SLC13 family permease [Gammaproteobacteria bacterium]|nr:SLC13 family permease [Gammaproteobacteria bacterium]
MTPIKRVALYLGPLLGLALAAWLNASGQSFDVVVTAGLTVWVALWWVFEPVPIPITSLLPLAVLPGLGVLSQKEVSAAYGHKLILLLLGGFLLSTAMAKSGAHRRLALNMVNLFGASSPKRVLWGFMAATALLSMWISNTATTLMMLPIALAVIESSKGDPKFSPMLLLGIAYAASIGGMGTPIGTPPNLAFMQQYSKATGTEPSFAEWMAWALPAMIPMLALAAWWLGKKIAPQGQLQLPSVGSWQSIEKRVLAVFALTALAWVTRKEPFGGWSEWFGLPHVNDAHVVLLAVVLMFVIPDSSRHEDGRAGRLLDWQTANQIPWGILLLYGGGLTIAAAFKQSGLSAILAEALSPLHALPLIALIAAVCLMVTFLTELTSNTATTILLLPVLAAAAVSVDVDPLLLMLPATLTASCAFMFPVATAPNVIVFGTGQLTVAQMARTGFVLNLLGVAVVTSIIWLLFAR